MEIGARIRKYRESMGQSQEELAEKIFVTRQTVSNWENGRSCPDIHNLLALGSVFGTSLDQLIKGDIETMKRKISKDEAEGFNRLGKLFSILFIAAIAVFVPLVVFLKIYGAVIWVILYLSALITAFRVERLKKDNDIHTYKEIVAFSEGKALDEIQRQREIGKRPYQTALKFISGGLVGAVIAAIAIAITALVGK